jgi:3-oxoadipate enol-lactonase
LRAQLREIILAYDASGIGRPLLSLHGYPLNRKLWRPQLENLTDSARGVAPDLRGHGQSSAPDEPYTVDRLADDLVELLDDLGLNPAVGGRRPTHGPPN